MRFNTSCIGLSAGPNFCNIQGYLAMKKTALILALLMSTVMLTACGSKYIAVTKDYTIYIGTKKPVINPENDSVSFEDDTGKTHTIPREDLKQVRPLP